MLYLNPGDEMLVVKEIDNASDNPNIHSYLLFTKFGQVIRYEVDLTLNNSTSVTLM